MSELAGWMAVWKYVIPQPNDLGLSYIEMPEGAAMLSVGNQDDELVVWALVDRALPPVRHALKLANTGGDILEFPPDARFLGTVTTSNGIVWHVWCRR